MSIGEKWHHHDAVKVLLHEGFERASNRWIAVAHGKLNAISVTQLFAHSVSKVLSVGQKGRTTFGPNGPVGLGRFGRTKRQNDQVQEQPSADGTDVHNSRIA